MKTDKSLQQVIPEKVGPFHATMLAVDVVAFGQLSNPAQLVVREDLYTMLAKAFDDGGIPWNDCRHEDRGDGALVVVSGDLPKTLLVDKVLSCLVAAVSAERQHKLGSFQLKIAIHAGEVHTDDAGIVGFDVNHVFRLVDSALLRLALQKSAMPCAVLVSDSIYKSVVAQGYGDIDPTEYIPAWVVNKEDASAAWLRVPGDVRAARKAAKKHAKADGPGTTSGGGVTIKAGRNVSMTDSVVAGGNVDIERNAAR